MVENSSGIRYFLCDDCHDAQVINIWSEGDLLFLELETSGMIGCLNISGNKCVIKIKTFDSKECEKLIDDFFINDRAYWFSSNILLENDCVYCNLILQMFYKNNYENYNYKFNIEDICVEEKINLGEIYAS